MNTIEAVNEMSRGDKLAVEVGVLTEKLAQKEREIARHIAYEDTLRTIIIANDL